MSESPPVHVTLRPATTGDCLRLWEWRNEPAARDSSFDPSYIPYADHKRWFAQKIKDPHTNIFIVLDENEREVGYIRFDFHEQQAEISVCVDQSERGKGYGQAAIRQGSDQLLCSQAVERIMAYVKPGNPSSITAFQRAGFVLAGVTEVGGSPAHELVYSRVLKGTELGR